MCVLWCETFFVGESREERWKEDVDVDVEVRKRRDCDRRNCFGYRAEIVLFDVPVVTVSVTVL